MNPDGYAVGFNQPQTIALIIITCCSTLGPMIVCGVKIGDQDHPVMVWILTETIMNTGVRYNGI